MPPKKTTPKVSQKTDKYRENIIHAVRTPLGFFALVVLVVEAILGIIAGISAGFDRTLAISGILLILASLVTVVAFFAYFRPEALKGSRAAGSVRVEPLESIETKSIFCGVTAEFEDLGTTEDIEIIRSEFPSQLVVERLLSRATLQDALTRGNFSIVHLIGYVNPQNGTFLLAKGDAMSSDGLAKLLTTCRARLVVLATCDSLLLASKLAPFTNVIAASGNVEVNKFLLWERAFYRLLAKGSKLSEAYDVARDASDIPTVLFMRRDAVFVPMLEGHKNI